MHRATVALAAAACAFAATPARADGGAGHAEETETGVLRREVAELRREVAELRAARTPESDANALHAAVDAYLAHRPAATGGSYVGPGGVLRPGGGVTLGGYFSTRYVSAQAGGNPTFADMRLVPQIHADITDRIAFNTEIEWEHGGVSDEHGGEVAVEYAELSFRWSDAFKFKAGTLLVPFGAFNQSHDDPINEMSSRPTVDRFVVPSAFSIPGIGAEGAVELSDEASLTYDVVLTNGFKDEITPEKGLRTARGLFDEDDNHDKTVFGRIGVVPTVSFLDALHVGASGAFGKIGAQSDPLRGFGVDAAAKSGPWEFKGEYDAFGIGRPAGSPPPLDAAGNLGPVRGLHGWYAQVLYRFTDPWVRSLPFAEDDASFALVLRRDMVDLNDRVHGASPQDDERAWSFGVTYRPTAKTAIKIEFRKASSGAPGDLGEDRDLFAVEFATYF